MMEVKTKIIRNNCKLKIFIIIKFIKKLIRIKYFFFVF